MKKIKEDYSDSEDDRNFRKDNSSKPDYKGAKDKNRKEPSRDKDKEKEEDERNRRLNKRAYEFYKSNGARKEDIYLG